MIKLIQLVSLISISCLLLSTTRKQQPLILPIEKSFSISGFAQGTTYSIKYIKSDSIISKTEIDSILDAIDTSLSLYTPTSLISIFNASKKGVIVDDHMKKVVERSVEFNLFSKGYFDITSKPLSDLWGFGFTPVNNAPTEKQIKHILHFVGANMIYFKNDSLLKRSPNTQIDCNGIAQGYSVDVLCDFLKAKKLDNFIVELGGEIKTSGSNISGKPWLVGIENPSNFNGNDFLIDKKIAVSNFAVTSSGSYRKFKKYGTKYVTHIINPLTGNPMNNEIISVTVIAENAMQADALDNVFALLGIHDSFELLKQLPETGLYILYKHPNGEVRDTSNQFFKEHLVAN